MVNFYQIIASTTVIMLAAEFGDKTHLIILSFMSKTKKSYVVALGGIIGISFVTMLGVYLGVIIGTRIPYNIISILGGCIFILLGLLTLREDDEGQNDEKDGIDGSTNSIKIFYHTAFFVALAELGDKSQIFVITASAASQPLAVLFGSLIGMSIIFLSSAVIGDQFLHRIEKDILEKIAGILFIVAGIWLILSQILG